jgi:hypothetical protein
MGRPSLENSGSRISNLIMGSLYLSIRGPSVPNVLIIQESERFDGDLVNFPRKAVDARPYGQLVEATHPVLLGGKLDEDGLHEHHSS